MVLPLIPILAVAGIAALAGGAGTVAVANAETAKANVEAIKAGGKPTKNALDTLTDMFTGGSGVGDLLPLGLLALGGVAVVAAVAK